MENSWFALTLTPSEVYLFYLLAHEGIVKYLVPNVSTPIALSLVCKPSIGDVCWKLSVARALFH